MTDLPRKKHYVGGVVFLVLVAIALAIVLNRAKIYDWYRGVSYLPTDEMIEIRDRLGLTSKGGFIFGAAQPELNTATEFNAHCRQDETEIAVLGCYTEGNIYIYNITDEKLDGIRELTAAHELLHATWARMSEAEKNDLIPVLERVYQDNISILEEDIATYTESERIEEIFVRAGTEIRDLLEDLEKFYAEVFEDQDKVVGYYEKYIGVFREIKARMEVLKEEIDVLNEEIGMKTEEYTKWANQLEADIISFNSCAEVAGCFEDESEFSVRRGMLLSELDELDVLNNEINQLINEHNAKVEEYNADVTESRKLQDMINSNSRVEL